LTLQYDKVLFLLEPSEITRELRRKRVTVVDYPDGRLAIRYRGLDLPYTTFDKLRQVSQATIVENKHLGAVLSHIRERQIERAEARSQSAPRRQGPLRAARGRCAGNRIPGMPEKTSAVLSGSTAVPSDSRGYRLGGGGFSALTQRSSRTSAARNKGR
jgi:hypothetical protein